MEQTSCGTHLTVLTRDDALRVTYHWDRRNPQELCSEVREVLGEKLGTEIEAAMPAHGMVLRDGSFGVRRSDGSLVGEVPNHDPAVPKATDVRLPEDLLAKLADQARLKYEVEGLEIGDRVAQGPWSSQQEAREALNEVLQSVYPKLSVTFAHCYECRH